MDCPMCGEGVIDVGGGSKMLSFNDPGDEVPHGRNSVLTRPITVTKVMCGLGHMFLQVQCFGEKANMVPIQRYEDIPGL